MFSKHAQRGQVFPIWAFGTLTILALLAFAANYGNAIYWQLRAQNAADAAAQGALSIQATHWNLLLSDLHAASIEEYRIRYLLRDLALVSSANAATDTGCTTGAGTTSCATIYTNLVSEYLASTNRYTQDVSLIQALDAPTYASDVTAVSAAIANFQTNCGTSAGGDCAFDYRVVNPEPRTSSVEDVFSDCCGSTVGGGSVSPAALNQNLDPLQIEVVACATVQPLFPAVLSWVNAPAFTAVGRAASSTLMATQEFMEVGGIINPVTAVPFQAAEFPESMNSGALFSNDDTYLRIDYGGNINAPNGDSGDPETSTDLGAFHGKLGNQLIDVFTGWWTTVAITPYSGDLNSTEYACK